MKVLHLYANYKWTGPAELALLLAEHTGRRLDGDLVVEPAWMLAGFVHPGEQHHLARRARELGLSTLTGLRLPKHLRPSALFADVATLARILGEDRFDLVHCHQSGDHLVAALAAPLASRPVPLVRSVWERPPRGPRGYLVRGRTAGWTVWDERDREELLARGVPAGRVAVVPPPIDESWFATPVPAARIDALRREIGGRGPWIGLVARIQRRRRWDLVWRTLQRVFLERPDARAIVVGRPDAGVFETLCAEPLQRLGIADRVVFAGYRSGQAYRDLLAAFDVGLFVVPGSDPSCRALREMMACGLPPVTTTLGRLESIVGGAGLCRAPEPAALAHAILHLLEDEPMRRSLGERARIRAQQWRPERTARATLELYERLLS